MQQTIDFQGQTTPARVFRDRARAWGTRPALRHKRRGLWQSFSWGDYYAQARAFGLALAEMGMTRGDCVSVLAENRPEWLIADIGAQCMGFVGNGVYPTSAPAQVCHVLRDSRSRVLIVENQEHLDKALGAAGCFAGEGVPMRRVSAPPRSLWACTATSAAPLPPACPR